MTLLKNNNNETAWDLLQKAIYRKATHDYIFPPIPTFTYYCNMHAAIYEYHNKKKIGKIANLLKPKTMN